MAEADGAGERKREVVAIELWRLPSNFFQLDSAAQWEAIAKVTVPAQRISSPRAPCKLTLTEEVLAVTYFLVILGVPLMVPAVTLSLLFTRPGYLIPWSILVALMAFHPIPQYRPWYRRNRMGVILAKYFTMTFLVDRGHPEMRLAATPEIDKNPPAGPVVPLACPHGVLNFGAITFVYFSRWICGVDQYTAGASVVTRVPGLRYLAASLWVVPADRGSLKRALQEPPRSVDKAGRALTPMEPRRGGTLGVVPDGIAGIFRSKPGKEVLYIGKKRGLMRICLEEGALVLGGWFSGTSELFWIVTDPFGIMEFISRRLQVSIFLFFGRWLSPVPRRIAITMCASAVRSRKGAAPTDEEVEQLHNEVYNGMARDFQELRHYTGYPDRELVIQ